MFQLTQESNKIGVLEKICPKPKVRTLSKNTSCATWHEFCIICIIYHVTMKNCNIEINKIPLRKKLSKTWISKGNSRNFQVSTQEKQVKTWCQATWFFLQNLWTHASFIAHLQVTNYKSLINWYSFNWSQKDERFWIRKPLNLQSSILTTNYTDS